MSEIMLPSHFDVCCFDLQIFSQLPKSNQNVSINICWPFRKKPKLKSKTESKNSNGQGGQNR